MVFYAYVKNINDDWSWRYVIAFASRSVGDEWWRLVSTSSNTKYSDSVRRVNSQFYTHDPGQANAAYSITDATVASGLLGKVFFTLLNDRDGRILSIIPPQDCTDNVSGNTFFIRSKASPNEYWYCPGSYDSNVVPESGIYVSSTERTRFRVRLANEKQGDKGTIMIGSDEITITLTSNNLSAKVSDGGQLIVSKNPESGMKFSSLVNGFRVGATLWNKDGNNGHVKELFKTDDGEEWELV